ncbi:MAG: inositol monophosphatase [Chloroflexi bacterium]|nr:inositol monophosphatase [Chloroflexota bacterium]
MEAKPQLWDDALAEEIEQFAVEIARGAGKILAGHFGRQIQVEFKDEHERDPVTAADKETQQYLTDEIAKRFPDHGVLGEEGTKEEKESEELAKDILWVLDPLDGTTNYMNGLPVFASSIGVMYRGWPIAAAVYIPWPTGSEAKTEGGFVLHCRKGGGCFADDEPVSVYISDEPVPSRLIGVPGYFGVGQGFTGKLAGKAGEVRTTGSIAYELAMTARGVLQYAMFGAPRLWDMVGGALAVVEAGGVVMTRFRGEKAWHPMESLIPAWETKTPTMKELRNWMAPLVAGNPKVAPLIADNVKRRFSLKAQFRKVTRPLRRRKKKPTPQAEPKS